jgi:ribose 5-phosphate isomerase B
MSKRIAIGCDHAGYELKELLKKWLEEHNYEFEDFGTHSTDSVDYPDFVHPVADAIEGAKANFGLLICGSANGVAMAANKHKKIRAAIAWKPELAELSRQHNDANILCLPSRFIGERDAVSCLELFLRTKFEGGRHQKRVDKISC